MICEKLSSNLTLTGLHQRISQIVLFCVLRTSGIFCCPPQWPHIFDPLHRINTSSTLSSIPDPSTVVRACVLLCGIFFQIDQSYENFKSHPLKIVLNHFDLFFPFTFCSSGARCISRFAALLCPLHLSLYLSRLFLLHAFKWKMLANIVMLWNRDPIYFYIQFN